MIFAHKIALDLTEAQEAYCRKAAGTARFTYNLNDSAQTPDRLPNYGLRSVPEIIAGVNSKDVLDLSKPGGVSRGSFLTSYFNPHQPTSRAH